MKTLYIEGTETDNGNLRKPFHFFWKELSGNMPRIIMGDGLQQKNSKKTFSDRKKVLSLQLRNGHFGNNHFRNDTLLRKTLKSKKL